MSPRTILALAALVVIGTACHRTIPAGAMVLTQTPTSAPASAMTVLDVRYPPGSRIALLEPPYRPDLVHVLSKGLVAAGDPCVSWDGRRVYFAGKATPNGEWQIYRCDLTGGKPEQVTNVPGGAMNPAVAAHEELVFSSPVPKGGQLWSTEHPVAIYGQRPGEPARRFTFGPESAIGATVLRDGRILFVSANPRDDRHAPRHLSLFAMNNDGTEITAYAGQDDGENGVRRPRELGDGRVAFLAGHRDDEDGRDWAETVRSAAPFATRSVLLGARGEGWRSIEWSPDSALLACIDTRGVTGRSMTTHAVVYRLSTDASAIGAPIFDDPEWNSLEAMPVVARNEPAGHTTAVMPTFATGTMLCLDVNDSRVPAAGGNTGRAAKLRVVALTTDGKTQELGTVPVNADGSVLVRLPVKMALGFDTLDAQGRVLRHQPPAVWLQPGENRGCVGCHERRNHAPRNLRPLATQIEPAHLEFPPQAAASTP